MWCIVCDLERKRVCGSEWELSMFWKMELSIFWKMELSMVLKNALSSEWELSVVLEEGNVFGPKQTVETCHEACL